MDIRDRRKISTVFNFAIFQEIGLDFLNGVKYTHAQCLVSNGVRRKEK